MFVKVFAYYEVEFICGIEGKSACGLRQCIVVVIEIHALERRLIDGPDEFVEPVIIFRGLLQQVIFIFWLNRGQFKE